MKKIKAFISRILAVPMIVSILPTNAFTVNEENNIFDNKSTKTTYIGTTGLADTTILPPLKIPPHTVNGDVAYCMQGEKNSPIDTPMSLSGNYDSDSFVRGVLFYGYPYNETNLMEKHGVTETQARGMTQFAIWYYYNPSYFAPKTHPYLDELRSLAASVSAPAAVMSADTSNMSININGGLQEAVNIRTSSDYSGTFTFPSDSNIYTTDINGNKKNTFGIGESFKVVATSSVKGVVTKTIDVSITEPTMLRFVPIGDSSIQELGVPTVKTTNSTMQLSIDFPGITATNGDIVVNKVSDVGEKLSGVEFGLYSDSSANTLIAKKTTDSEGKVIFDSLNIGTTYYIKELSSIDGYIMDNSIKTVELLNTTENITVTNTKIMGQIKITKNETGLKNKKLKGAEFNILDSSNSIVDTITTDDNGEAISKKLPYGDYKIVENIAPIGYVLSSVETPVKITENNKTYEFEYENDIIKGKIEILKLDADGNNPLQGVTFGIYNSTNDNLIEELTTGSDGRITSSSLTYGSYYVKEIQPLNGYVNDDKKYPVDITENNKVYVVDVFNSKLTGDLSIIKIDVDTGKPLANVEFKIDCLDGFDKGNSWSVVTDNNGVGKVNGLKYGDYQISEIRTLTGYVLDTTPVPFTIDKDGQKIEKTISNEKIKGNFELLKYDPDTKEPLANVEFEIECIEGFDKGNKTTFVTGDDGIYRGEKINYGKYKVVEIKTLEGYVLDTEPIYFEITENGQDIEINKANRKIYGQLEFSKTDLTTGEVVEGAHIKITGLDELNKDVVIEFVSSAEGNSFTLPYGKYEIIETIEPEGYIKTEEVGYFEILEDGEIVHAEIKNKRILGSLIINKLSKESNKPLSGAEFGVYDENDELIAKVTTDEDGYAEVLDLPYGEYYYVELKAPDGYLVNLDTYDFSITFDGEVVEQIVYNSLLNPYPDGGEENLLNGPLPDTSGFRFMGIIIGSIAVVGLFVIYKSKKLNI